MPANLPLSNRELLSMKPDALIQYMERQYALNLPKTLETVEEMKEANRLLSMCTSNYAYLANLAMIAKLEKRKLKREKASKEEIEDALSREEIIQKYTDINKLYYQTISRMITVKQQINQEMRMSM